MPKKALALLAFHLLLVSGCTVPDPTFVVYREIPEKPTFVIIPANHYLYQVEFANTVEAVIMSAGARVVDRPGLKEVVTESKLGQAQAEGGVAHSEVRMAGTTEAEAKVTERYFEYEEINADYIVRTYADAKQVRIIKKDTKEILAAIAYDPVYGGYKVHKTLESMGIPVKPAVKPKPKTQ